MLTSTAVDVDIVTFTLFCISFNTFLWLLKYKIRNYSTLTDYCREEFGKFRAEFGQFWVKLVNFSGEKGRFGYLLRS